VGRAYRIAYASASLTGLTAVVRSGQAIAALTRTAMPEGPRVLPTESGLPSIADPGIPADVVAYLARQGISTNDFDLLIALDLDPSHPAGGFGAETPDGTPFIHMGYFFSQSDTADLDPDRLHLIGNAVYGHEVLHHGVGRLPTIGLATRSGAPNRASRGPTR
jgi:hypothetical protein